MYVPLPFYNADSIASSGYWKIVLTQTSSTILNVLSTLFPSLSIQIGQTFNFDGNTIKIENIVYDTEGEMVLFVRTVFGSTSKHTFNDVIFSGLGGIGISNASMAIRSITNLDENFFTIVLVYGGIAFLLYEIFKK